MSSIKKRKSSKSKSKSKYDTPIYNSKITADYAGHSDKHNEIDTAVYLSNNHLGRLFGKRTSRKRTKLGRINKKRRTSRKRTKHSFGTTSDSNFKRFLVIAIIVIARSMIKKDPKSVNFDIKNIQYGALNFLTITSLLELIEYLFGAKIRDHVVLGYVVLSIGLNMSELV